MAGRPHRDPAANRAVAVRRCRARRLALCAAPAQRAGRWRDGAGQRRRRHALLETALSPRGNAKAQAIMALEMVLREIEQGRRPHRDPLNYAFTLFGRPDAYPWGWRVEGHHLIVNATIAGPEAVRITPTFWGTNPATNPARAPGRASHHGARVSSRAGAGAQPDAAPAAAGGDRRTLARQHHGRAWPGTGAAVADRLAVRRPRRGAATSC